MKEYDFVVIGSGIAGLSFALKAARRGSVAVITKRKGADTNTAWAQGGIACVTSDEDSFELHVRDTLEAGAGLCDEAVVRTIVTEGPERIRELAELGLQFDEREVSGHREFDLGKEGGHSKRRVLHVRDVTGMEIEETLLRELGRQSEVQHPGRSHRPRNRRLRKSLFVYDESGHRDWRRCGDGVARRRGDRQHGVYPVSSHVSFSSPGEIISHFGSSARRRRYFAQQSWRRLYETLRSAWLACAA